MFVAQYNHDGDAAMDSPEIWQRAHESRKVRTPHINRISSWNVGALVLTLVSEQL